MQIETKAAGAPGVDGGAVATADPSEFEIICSVTGVRDEVNDVVEPGAYADTLRRRRPKIIKDHDWQQRLGKVLHIEEYLPGDARLPKVTAQGQSWPREAGALVAKVRLFGSDAGKDAAERWREYGQDQQFSIGYVVPQGKAAKDPKTGVRHIKSLDLFEVSDVLWAAMPMCGPMPSSLATKMLPALVTDDDDEGADHASVEVEAKALIAEGAEALDDDVHAALVEVLLNEPGEKYDTSPVGTPGGRQNWVDKAGGLPAFIRAIAHAMIRHGADASRAIATAVAACKRWAAGAGNVTAKTRAKAAAAIAEWTRKHTAGKGLMEITEDAFFGWQPDLGATAGEKAAPVALETKGAPRLPGTFEERRDLIAVQVKGRLGASSTIVGTTEDHVIASRLVVNDEGDPTGIESYRVGYTVRGGLVHIDEPEPVALSLHTDDGTLTAADIHLADVVEEATLAAKALLLPGIEGKAGRVLSGGNAGAIKNAVVALLKVLQAAGVAIDAEDAADGGKDEATEKKAAPDETGAKALALDGLPDPHDLVASLRAAARAE